MDNFTNNLKGKKTKKVATRTKTINLSDGGVKKVTETKVIPIKKKKQPKPKKYKSVGDEVLSTIAPLKQGMIDMLATRGHNAKDMSFPTIVATFHNEFLTQNEDKTSKEKPVAVSDFENDFLFKIPQGTEVDNIGFSEVAVSVGGIVNFFKKANTKRKAAKKAKIEIKQALTPTEQKAAVVAKKVEKKLEKEVKADEPVKQGNAKKYIIFGVIGVVIVLLIIMIAKK